MVNAKTTTGFFHELVHAFRHVTGTEASGSSKEINPDTGKQVAVKNDELQATGLQQFEDSEGPSENKFRKQAGLEKRLTYTDRTRDGKKERNTGPFPKKKQEKHKE